MKTLVVYYSRTGNTKYVAEKIAEHLGAENCDVIDKKKSQRKTCIFNWGVMNPLEKN